MYARETNVPKQWCVRLYVWGGFEIHVNSRTWKCGKYTNSVIAMNVFLLTVRSPMLATWQNICGFVSTWEWKLSSLESKRKKKESFRSRKLYRQPCHVTGSKRQIYFWAGENRWDPKKYYHSGQSECGSNCQWSSIPHSTKNSKLDPQQDMEFNVITRRCFFFFLWSESYPFAEDTVIVFYLPSIGQTYYKVCQSTVDSKACALIFSPGVLMKDAVFN